MEEARAHAAQILKIKPDYTVEFYRKTTPYKDKAYLEGLVDLMQKAGLPDWEDIRRSASHWIALVSTSKWTIPNWTVDFRSAPIPIMQYFFRKSLVLGSGGDYLIQLEFLQSFHDLFAIRLIEVLVFWSSVVESERSLPRSIFLFAPQEMIQHSACCPGWITL